MTTVVLRDIGSSRSTLEQELMTAEHKDLDLSLVEARARHLMVAGVLMVALVVLSAAGSALLPAAVTSIGAVAAGSIGLVAGSAFWLDAAPLRAKVRGVPLHDTVRATRTAELSIWACGVLAALLWVLVS